MVVPAERVAVKNGTASEQILETWAAHGVFSLAQVDGHHSAPEVSAERATTPLAVRAFDSSWVDQIWRRTSYSSLTAASHEAGAATSEPESDAVGRDDEEPVAALGARRRTGWPRCRRRWRTCRSAPRSDRLVHAVLEDVDLQADSLHA